MSLKSLITIFFTLFYGFTAAQLYETSRYADDNGLPSRIVHDVIQDKNGFIWVAGNNGLFRFDGKQFKAFKANLKDTIGLRNNRINTLIEASDGAIWLGTPMGLHKMEDGRIDHIDLIDNATDSQQYVLSIFEDAQKRIWIGTYGGVFLIESDSEPIHFLEESGVSDISSEAIWDISQDLKGQIWVSTNKGPFIMQHADDFAFKQLTLEYDEKLPIDAFHFFQSRHLSDSLVLLGTSRGLLKGKFAKNGNLQLERLKDEQGKSLGEYSIQDFILKDDNIYVATWKNGLIKVQQSQGFYSEVEIQSRNGIGDISGDVKSLFEDRQGNLWVANTNGLFKLSLPERAIINFPPRHGDGCLNDFYGVYSLLEGKSGYIWATTPLALYRFSKSDILNGGCPDKFLKLSDENMQLSRDIFIDSKNRLWIGADGGLFVTQLDQNQNPGEFVRYTTKDGLPHNWTYGMMQIDENNFWLGNYAGFLKLTLKNGDLGNPEFTTYVHDSENLESLVNSQAMNLGQDKDGTLWVGTFSGLSRLVNEFGEGSFENYISSFGDFESLSNNSIKRIFSDSKENLWVATQRGLNRYDFEKNGFQQFGHAEGLPSEYVLGLAEDSKGFLWICTTNGVLKAKFDETENKLTPVSHYTSQDGLVDNIPYRNSILIDAEDNVIIGSRDGISVIQQKETQTANASDFNLVLTGLDKIDNKDEGFTSILEEIKDNSITLSYQENSIKVNYAALDFVSPEFNSYRHKFLPNNPNWIQTGADSELTYYNLPSGDYELVLDGANHNGQWSAAPLHLKFSIEPPFWKSNWAMVIYFLAFLGILRLFYLMRIRKKEHELEQKIQMETAIVNEREQLRNENAADFHDELGSMVTKISMFLTMAERNFDEGEDPTPFFQKIRNNVKGLSRGFRDLLWVIDPQKDSLADTFLRLKEFGEDFFEQSKIDFKTSKFQDVYEERMLSPKTKKQVVMIFKEAMTNAIKYSDGSEAKLVLETNGNFSRMSFTDNGSGFDVSKKSKGRGLTNMQTRAKKIAAMITISSSSQGTSIVLDRIPHMGDVFSDKRQ